jgi:ParB family chromosome partitioning protein
MTRKIRYKDASPQLERMASPNFETPSRASVGMEKFVGEYFYLDVEKLIPFRNQARKIFDQEEIEQLARTIKEHGVRQPLTVSKSDIKEGCFEVISGERRLRAAKIAGLSKIPCIIIPDSKTVDEIAIIENIQRTDLHPIELGRALQKILTDAPYGKQIEIAEKLGIKESSVSESLKFAELPEEISAIILEKNIRSREILRRVVKAENIAAMKQILSGVARSKKSDKNVESLPVKPQSVLRISCSEKGFLVQKSKLAFLNTAQKAELRALLLQLMKDIRL